MIRTGKGAGLLFVLLAAALLLNSPPLLAQNQQAAPQTQAVFGQNELPGKLGEIVAKTPLGTGKGQIDPQAEKGFAGLPGAPQINYAVAFLWAIWVGWIFSTVGAFGGIMAGVGHLTLFGLGAYAASFKGTNPELNALLTDTIRTSNQFLVGLAALISTWSFFRMKRIVVPLGLALGIGSISGGLLIPWLTAGKIQLSQYIGWFGIAVLVIGGFILYSTTERSQSKKSKAAEASKAFQRAMKEQGDDNAQGVRVVSFSVRKTTFSFYGTEFTFNPLLGLLGGLVIASIASFLGIGGGFLYVPFLTSIIGLPMYIVAGTSALAVLLSMISSIFSFVYVGGTYISWSLVGVEMAGVAVGAFIGPKTQKYIPEKWLKWLFVVLAAYVGIRYFSKGFFGQSWLPPF